MIGTSGMAQGVTFDFDNDYATLFPTLKGVSSSTSEDGNFTEATTSAAVEGFTVTVAPAADAKTPSRIWSSAPRLRMYSGTFTVSGKGIKRIEFTNGSNFNISTTTGTLEGSVWTGEADEVVFDVAKNTQINKLVINGDGGSVTPTEPEHTNVTIADLAAATAKIENVNLTLTNAQVVYANGSRVFVREGNKAILFYNIGVSDLATNAILNGSIKGKLDIYNNLNEFVKTSYTNANSLSVTQSETVAEPLSISVADAASYISNLVRFNGVTISDVNGKNATANIGDATLAIYDQFGVMPADTEGKFDITGVITIYKTTIQIYPTVVSVASAEEEQGLSWDFTNWSEATVAALKAEAAKGIDGGSWSDVESATKTSEWPKDKCFWQVAVQKDNLTAGDTEIAETKGLKFINTADRALAIAVNYPLADQDESKGFGPYHGGAYLWLGSKNINYFIIPGVAAGATIEMGVESHKISDARGVKLYAGADETGAELKSPEGTDVAYPKTYTEQKWQMPADATTTDVCVRNNNGCHIYYIKVVGGAAGINTVKAAKTQNGAIYNMAGQKVGNDYKGLVIKNGRKYIQK